MSLELRLPHIHVLFPRLGVCILDSGLPNITLICNKFLQFAKKRKTILTLCVMTSASTLVSISIINILLLENV